MKAAQGYLVLADGYNIIKRHAAWSRLPIGESRRRLVDLLARTRWPVPAARVVAVFDGGGAGGEAASGGVQIRYAPSADAYIQQAIRTSASPRQILIISNDGEILSTAKSHGAARRSVEWLLERLRPAAPRPGNRPRHPEESDKPSVAAARLITEELARRWLKPPP